MKNADDLGTPGSKLRNKILAPVFHDTNLAETKGTGIKRMRDLMQKAHLAQPTFESSRERNEFTIRLLLHHFLCSKDLAWLASFNDDELNDAQKTALIFVREIGAIDNQAYRQMGNCDTLKASSDLRKLRDKGFLEKKGSGSASYYIPTERILNLVTDQAEAVTDQAEAVTDQAEAVTDQAEAEGPASVMRDGLPHDLQHALRGLKKRVPAEEMEELILRLCAQRPLTRRNLAALLSRRESMLKPMLRRLIAANHLRYLYPEMPKHPRQAYVVSEE